jgi:hypothetical protein
VNGTEIPFLLRVRQNKWYLDVATSRTVVSELIFTIDRVSSGPIKTTVIDTAISSLPAWGWQRMLEHAVSVQRARWVLAVALDFDFLFIVSVGTVVAAVRHESGNLTLTLRVRAFLLTTYIENFCHDAPPCF